MKLLMILLSLSMVRVHAQDLTKIVYAAPTTIVAAIPYIAQINGYFKDQNIKIEEKLFSSGREALDALVAKEAHFQTSAETPLVHAILQGNNIVTIATVAVNGETKLIARKDRGIVKETDLKGKKVGNAPGTNSDYFMHAFLRGHKMTQKDITIFNLKSPQMKTALVKGDIDAYFSWEPHIYYAKKELGEKAVVFEPGERYSGRHTVNMNPDFVEKNPDVVRGIVRALLKAEEFINKHPEKAQELVADKLGVNIADVREIWKEIDFKVQLDKGVIPLYEKIAEWSARLNKRTAPLPDFKKHVYTKALVNEKKNAVAPELH